MTKDLLPFYERLHKCLKSYIKAKDESKAMKYQSQRLNEVERSNYSYLKDAEKKLNEAILNNQIEMF